MILTAVKKPKQPKFGAKPDPKKKPVFLEPQFEDGHPLAWRLGQVDREGSFAWNIQPHEKFREIVHKLAEFEDKSWAEIKKGGSHQISTEKLCNDARQRLVKIQRDDLDELVSLRMTGTNRVWCVKSGHILRLLWWDQDHLVCPVAKDPADRGKQRRRK